jgi:hypothetical protein
MPIGVLAPTSAGFSMVQEQLKALETFGKALTKAGQI